MLNIQERNIPPNYQYCGPSTRLDIRLDENNKPKSGEEPINRVDQTCYEHDVGYQEAGDDLQKKHTADLIMLQQLNAITAPTIKERPARLLIKAAISTELKLGVGITSFNSVGDLENREKLAEELFKEYRRPATYLKVKSFWKR